MASRTSLSSKEQLRPSQSSSSSASTPSPSTAAPAADADAARLAELGYSQDLSRNFSVWSILGVGFSLTNSWFGLSAALVTGLSSGGTALIVYGVILVAAVSTCIASSLSELASAYPSAGGQYYWAHELAPPRWKRLASYVTGWFSWAGAVFTSASVALSMALAMVGCYALAHPGYSPNPYHVFATYQLLNIVAALFNTNGRLLPSIATVTLYVSLLAFATILITVPSVTPAHQPASFVFASFRNDTGYASPALAFIVGLINTNWPFACLDCATHLAEEVPRPARNIPIAIMGTVAIGFVTAWTFAVAMFFSLVGDIDTLTHTPTGVPILALFDAALAGRPARTAAAIALESLIIATGVGCLIAAHTWQSRLVWSFARDNGVPGSKYLAVVDARAGVPLRAHLVSVALVAAVGCLYLGSQTAFNSMVTACIVLLYLSYAIPVSCLVFVRGRARIPPGPFWLGRAGLVANIVLLAWTLFTLVMYSFPYTMPVTASTMNYVSVVYAVVVVIVAVDWFARGHRAYKRAQCERRASVASVDVVAPSPSGKRGSVSYGTV